MCRHPEKPYQYETESEVTLKQCLGDDNSARCLLEKSELPDTGDSAASTQGQASASLHPSRLSTILRKLILQSKADALDEARAAQERKRRSAAIDEYLEAEGSKMSRDMKIVVFGSADLDVLFMRQALLAKDALTDQEREESASVIRSNVLECARCYLRHIAETFSENDDTQESNAAAKMFLQELNDTLDNYKKGEALEEAEAIVNLLQGSQFEGYLEQCGISSEEMETQAGYVSGWSFRNCFCSSGCSILQRLQRAFSPDYVATEHEWYHFSKQLCGFYIREVKLERDKYNLRFLQLGRCGGERKKWVHFLENSNMVTTVLDLASFDEDLFEDRNVSYLQESLLLFESIVCSRWFSSGPVLIVMINEAKFRSKMETSPSRFTKCFPEFEGKDANAAILFLQQRLIDLSKGRKGVWPCIFEIADPAGFRDMVNLIDQRILPDYFSYGIGGHHR